MLDLHELNALPTTAPIFIHEQAEPGHVTRLAVRVSGQYHARRLRALFEITQLPTFHPEYHATFLAYHTATATWLITLNGNAGRTTHHGDTLTLDDGFGHPLTHFRLPPTPGVRGGRTLALELAARFLHNERAGEVPCRVCGCSASWPCDDGCSPVHPGLCSACAALTPPLADSLRGAQGG